MGELIEWLALYVDPKHWLVDLPLRWIRAEHCFILSIFSHTTLYFFKQYELSISKARKRLDMERVGQVMGSLYLYIETIHIENTSNLTIQLNPIANRIERGKLGALEFCHQCLEKLDCFSAADSYSLTWMNQLNGEKTFLVYQLQIFHTLNA